jgi:hypothetical protein
VELDDDGGNDIDPADNYPHDNRGLHDATVVDRPVELDHPARLVDFGAVKLVHVDHPGHVNVNVDTGGFVHVYSGNNVLVDVDPDQWLDAVERAVHVLTVAAAFARDRKRLDGSPRRGSATAR